MFEIFGEKVTIASAHSVGVDMYLNGNLVIPPFAIVTWSSGYFFKVPEGQWVLLKERSSLAQRGIILLGGVIDSDYTLEVKFIFHNLTNAPQLLTQGDKVVQAILLPNFNNSITSTVERIGGLGSSGNK